MRSSLRLWRSLSSLTMATCGIPATGVDAASSLAAVVTTLKFWRFKHMVDALAYSHHIELRKKLSISCVTKLFIIQFFYASKCGRLGRLTLTTRKILSLFQNKCINLSITLY